MSIKIYDNKCSVLEALTSYFSKTEGYQDYCTIAGCTGDVITLVDKTSQSW